MVSFIVVLGLFSGASAELVGQWKLDEGDGTTALDASGNGNDGTLEDGPTVVDGQYGQALAFEESRVAIGASDTLTANLFQGSFTLSAWINPKRTGDTWQQVFRSLIAADTSNDTLFINNDGRLSWRGRINAAWAGGMCETAPDVVPTDQWTHVAVTGDGTNFRIYRKVLTQREIQLAMRGDSLIAWGPNPADGVEYVYPNVELSWSPGEGAQLHIVYFGDNFDDLNKDPGGILLETTTYTPGPLESDKVYYWRVDEFDGVIIHKGDVWSFTVADPMSEALDSGPHTLE